MRSRQRPWISGIILLAAAPIAVGVEKADPPIYSAVFMGGGKIGHSVLRRSVADGKVTTSVSLKMTVSRGGVSLTVTREETTVETVDGRPLEFMSTMDLGGMLGGKQTTRGVIGANNRVKVTMTAAGQTQSVTQAWPKGALMPEGVRLLQARKGLKEGTSYGFSVWLTDTKSAQPVQITIGPSKKVDLLGRVVTLTEVRMKMALLGEQITHSYMDKDLNALKTVTSMMGMQMEMVVCDKSFALSKDDVVDFVAKTLLRAPKGMTGVRSARSVVYEIQPIRGRAKKLSIPTTDNQTVRSKGNRLILTVRPVRPARGGAIPYKGKDPRALKAMKPTSHLQSGHKKIIALARRAVGDAKDAAVAAGKIESFVRTYMQSKDLSVGYATALEVAESRQGDCTEHSALLAALCRAAGIPAELVTGVAYVPEFGRHRNVFGGHQWVRAHVGGKWIGLDASLGYDAGHIALASGTLGESGGFLALLRSFGKFRITKATVRK